MLLLILAFIIPSVFAYDRSACNCETLLNIDGCDWVNEMNPQTGITGRVVCNNVVLYENDFATPGYVWGELENADLRGAKFTGVRFDLSVHSIDFRGAELNIEFSKKTIRNCDFRNASGIIQVSGRTYWGSSNKISDYSPQGPLSFGGESVIHMSDLQSIVYSNIVAAYADGAASVTPDDGIGQADVDTAVNNLKADEGELMAAYKELKC